MKEEERSKQREEWLGAVQEQSQLDTLAFGDQLEVAKQVFVQCPVNFKLQGNAETRLENIGYRVGLILVEKIAKDLPRFNSELDKMKFLCKEFWTVSFGKQVDNLRTNHQGVYVVQDNRFFALISFAEGKQYADKASIYLALPCGIIRWRYLKFYSIL
ncbi:unnamed protein product [Enterobius vermicularis]|uniref:Trafficking protein particle complex subunit 6B n=1 Tax=Enterobius vermicularis TaxID=51028 RepID=A0A0N4V9N7_ENTVE|nr:unnamed protein product [Enterobius vermicularis]